MSTSGYAARVGAAAFVLGIAMGTPLVGPAPAAFADAPDTSISDSGTTDSGGTATAKPARTAREPKTSTRADTGEPTTSPRAAAAVEPADEPADKAARLRRGARHQPGVDAKSPAPTPAASIRQRPVRSVAPPVSAPVTAVTVAADAAQSAVQTASPRTLTVVTAAEPVAPTATPTATAAPSAVTTVSTPTAAATSSAAAVLDGLFGSFRGFFEGAALLWRRRLFNEAPTVNPVQLTGLLEGPITGSIGAVDPEGDPLLFTVTGDPRYGAVTVSPDGNYTYTPGTDFAGSDSFVVAVTDTGRHINLRDLRRPKSTDASVSVAQGEQAPLLRFQFVYGYGSQYWSSEARSALESAATRLAGYFVVTNPVTITYAVTGQSSALSATLASAGSDFVDAASGFMQTVVQQKIQTGVDPNGSAADGEISWNFGPSWGYGDAMSNSQYDFQSTAMHELLHTLGFLSYIDKAANNTGRTWTIFDSFVVTSGGAAVIGTDYKWKTAYNANLTGGNGGLYFGGTNAVTAYGGPVPLYTPFPFQSGSSMSHLDDDTFVGSDEKLMTAVSAQGKGIRVLSPVELAIMADIGYQLAPQPNTWGTSTLMLVGFLFIRRPRRRPDAGPGSDRPTSDQL